MIAIKDMEMPKNCAECPLTYPRWDFNIGCKYCNAILGHHEDYGKYKTERHPDCQLVEIVTCKDCRHWKFDENSSILCGYCTNLETETNEDFYCADAERRE